MHPKEMQSGLISRTLFGLFIHLVNELEKVHDHINEHNIENGIDRLYNAGLIEEKIKKIWGQKQDLLSGLLIYLHNNDEYFNPKLNTEDLFFRKIFTFNSDLLEKIGKGIIKPAFPFVNIDNHKKKIILIR